MYLLPAPTSRLPTTTRPFWFKPSSSGFEAITDTGNTKPSKCHDAWRPISAWLAALGAPDGLEALPLQLTRPLGRLAGAVYSRFTKQPKRVTRVRKNILFLTRASRFRPTKRQDSHVPSDRYLASRHNVYCACFVDAKEDGCTPSLSVGAKTCRRALASTSRRVSRAVRAPRRQHGHLLSLCRSALMEKVRAWSREVRF